MRNGYPTTIYLGRSELNEVCQLCWKQERTPLQTTITHYRSPHEMYTSLLDHHPICFITLFGLNVLPFNTLTHLAVA